MGRKKKYLTNGAEPAADVTRPAAEVPTPVALPGPQQRVYREIGQAAYENRNNAGGPQRSPSSVAYSNKGFF